MFVKPSLIAMRSSSAVCFGWSDLLYDAWIDVWVNSSKWGKFVQQSRCFDRVGETSTSDPSKKISHHGRLHENHSSAGPRHTTERGEEEGKLVVRIDWIKNQQVDRNLQHFQDLDSKTSLMKKGHYWGSLGLNSQPSPKIQPSSSTGYQSNQTIMHLKAIIIIIFYK